MGASTNSAINKSSRALFWIGSVLRPCWVRRKPGANLNPFAHRMLSWGREDIWGHQHCSTANQENNETYSWPMRCPSPAVFPASCWGLCLWKNLYIWSLCRREELGNRESWPDSAAQELWQDVALAFWAWLKWMAFYNTIWKEGGGNSGPIEVSGVTNWVCVCEKPRT